MLRTILTLGLLTLLGLAAVQLFFGVFGVLVVGLLRGFFWLLGVALQIALVGLVVYLVIRLVSPETARRLPRTARASAPRRAPPAGPTCSGGSSRQPISSRSAGRT